MRPVFSAFAFAAVSLAVALGGKTASADEPVSPASGSAPASTASPASTAVRVTASCTLVDRGALDPIEARTATEVVCSELAKEGAAGDHEVRFGRLGGRTVVTVTARDGQESRRVTLTTLEEIQVAAPRLARAIATGAPIDETRTVDNVLGSETRVAKKQGGAMGLDAALFGMTTAGAASGGSAGVALGLVYRSSRVALGSLGRLGGIGGHNRIASLDLGGRYYFTDGDIAPFAGGGFAISSIGVERDWDSELEGSGFGGYATVGVELLRTHHTSLEASLRVDAPAYALEGYSYSSGYFGAGGASRKEQAYVTPLSLNIGLSFH